MHIWKLATLFPIWKFYEIFELYDNLKLDICLDRLLSTLAQMFYVFYYSTLIKDHSSPFTQHS